MPLLRTEESLDVVKKSLWTDAAKATAKSDGAKNREVLRAANLLNKTWPVRISCRRYFPGAAGAKILHFIRHGQGFHNSFNDFCKVFGENFDPPLTEIGRQQALALRSYARTTAPELVVVSPMSRALMTSNIAYAHVIGRVPFLAHEGCKEKKELEAPGKQVREKQRAVLEAALAKQSGPPDVRLIRALATAEGDGTANMPPAPVQSFRRAVTETLAFLAVRKVAAGHDGQAIAALERAELACISCLAFAEAASGRSTKALELLRGLATLNAFLHEGDPAFFASVWKARCRLGARGALRALQQLGAVQGQQLPEALQPLAQTLDALEVGENCQQELQPFLVSFRTEEARKESVLRFLDFLGAPTLCRHPRSSKYRQSFIEAFAPLSLRSHEMLGCAPCNLLSLHVVVIDHDWPRRKMVSRPLRSQVPPHGMLPACSNREVMKTHIALQSLAVWPRETLLHEVLVESLRQLSAKEALGEQAAKLPRRVLRASEDPRLYFVYAHGLWHSGIWGACEMYTQFCRDLASFGIVVIAMEHEDGSGIYAVDSEGQTIHYKDPPEGQDIRSFRAPNLQQRTEEIAAMVRALKNFPTDVSPLSQVMQQTDPDRLALIGHSLGAAGAIRYLRTMSEKEELCPFQFEPLLEEDLAFTPQVDFAVFLSGEWMENSTFLSGNRQIVANSSNRGARCWAAMQSPGTSHQWISETQMIAPFWVLRRSGLMGSGDWFRCYAATAKASGQILVCALGGKEHEDLEPWLVHSWLRLVLGLAFGCLDAGVLSGAPLDSREAGLRRLQALTRLQQLLPHRSQTDGALRYLLSSYQAVVLAMCSLLAQASARKALDFFQKQVPGSASDRVRAMSMDAGPLRPTASSRASLMESIGWARAAEQLLKLLSAAQTPPKIRLASRQGRQLINLFSLCCDQCWSIRMSLRLDPGSPFALRHLTELRLSQGLANTLRRELDEVLGLHRPTPLGASAAQWLDSFRVALHAETGLPGSAARRSGLCERALALASPVATGSIWSFYGLILLLKLHREGRGSAELWRASVRATSRVPLRKVLWLLHLAACEARADGDTPEEDWANWEDLICSLPEDDTEEDEPQKEDPDSPVHAIFTPSSGCQITVPSVPIEDGMQIWGGNSAEWEVKGSASDATLSELPPHFLGGRLLRARSLLQVTSLHQDARLYVVLEVPSGKSTPGESGTSLTTCLANGQRWISEGESAPSWLELEGGASAFGRLSLAERHRSDVPGKGKRPELLRFSTFAPKGVSLTLPQVILTGDPPRGFVVVVPLMAGCFNVSMSSDSTELQVQKATMDEGVVAWTDRDHQYLDVPEYLKHGVLFQQPFKDIPAGTVLTVRPNSAAYIYVITERRSGNQKPSWAEPWSSGAGMIPVWAVPVSAKGPVAGLALSISFPNLEASKEDLGISWHLEEAAPRWHELPTMRTYSRYCPAGWPLSLPPCHAPPNDGLVFSVVVTPVTAQSTAPLEVSCYNEGFVDTELLTLEEGTPLRSTHGQGSLVEVPLWMCGSTLIRPDASHAPSSSSSFVVRPAAPSVVYALLPATTVASEYAARWGNGWEAREEAPEGAQMSRLAVVARRVLPRELVGVPPKGSSEVLAVVVKVDVEAFDASVECNNGLEFSRSQVKETGLAWTDRQNRLAWIPECMKGGLHFRGPHELHTRRLDFNASYEEHPARSGRGLPQLLLQNGWFVETAPPPAWQDSASKLKLLSKRCPEGEELLMPFFSQEPDPRTEAPVLFMVMVVGLGPERLGEELRRCFGAWDTEQLQGFSREQLAELLRRLCPELDEAKRKMVLKHAFTTPKGEMRKVMPYEEFVEKLLRFAAVGERQRCGVNYPSMSCEKNRRIRASRWVAWQAWKCRRGAGCTCTEDAQCKQLQERLIMVNCADAWSSLQLPLKRLPTVESASQLAAEYLRLQGSNDASLMEEYKSLQVPQVDSLKRRELLSRLQRVAMWRVLPLHELRKDCQETELRVSTTSEDREELLTRLLAVAWSPAAQAPPKKDRLS
eukprot:g3791.t1